MSRDGGLPRRTILIVVGIHAALLLVVGLPLAQCHKPPPIKPVEIVDLGSLRPGPGLPSPTPSAPAATHQTQESTATPTSTPEPVEEPTPTPPAPEPQPEPKPEPKPETKPEPKPETVPAPETKPKPTPQPEPPKKHQVKVSSAKKKVTAASTETKSPAPKSNDPPGPSASDIKNRLASKIPGETGGGGGDGAGNAGRPDGIADDFSWYRALIKQCIQSSWKKPPIPAGEKIYTEVEIKISESGAVTFLRISRPSGDPAMDASVEQAVRSTPKLPKPLPAGLGSPDYTVIIQFKLE